MRAESFAIMRRFGRTALMLCAAPALLFAKQGTGSDASMLPAEDTAYARAIVARVGPKIITGKEFLLAYNFGPAFPKREKDSKQKFLQYMINEKLLALDAEVHGGGSASPVVRSVAEIEHDLSTEELYRQDVLRKVHIAKEELRNAVAASVPIILCAGSMRRRRNASNDTRRDLRRENRSTRCSARRWETR